MSALTRTVGTVVEKKPVSAIEASQTVEDAINLMETHNSHAVGVTVSGHFAGLFTNSDLIKKVVRQGRNPRNTSLLEVMTVNPLTVTRDCSFREAFFYLCKYNYCCLPVAEDGQFYGIVSEEDLRQEVALSLRQVTTENLMLMSYIKGESYGMGAG